MMRSAKPDEQFDDAGSGGDNSVAINWPVFHNEMKDAGKVYVWPRELAKPVGPPHYGMNFNLRVGKKAAGREIDGRTWDEYPK